MSDEKSIIEKVKILLKKIFEFIKEINNQYELAIDIGAIIAVFTFLPTVISSLYTSIIRIYIEGRFSVFRISEIYIDNNAIGLKEIIIRKAILFTMLIALNGLSYFACTINSKNFIEYKWGKKVFCSLIRIVWSLGVYFVAFFAINIWIMINMDEAIPNYINQIISSWKVIRLILSVSLLFVFAGYIFALVFVWEKEISSFKIFSPIHNWYKARQLLKETHSETKKRVLSKEIDKRKRVTIASIIVFISVLFLYVYIRGIIYDLGIESAKNTNQLKVIYEEIKDNTRMGSQYVFDNKYLKYAVIFEDKDRFIVARIINNDQAHKVDTVINNANIVDVNVQKIIEKTNIVTTVENIEMIYDCFDEDDN